MNHALHIGLNFVNPKSYGGWDGKLTGCVNDAKSMKSIINANGYVAFLLNNKATYANVERAMLYIAQLATSKDSTFITYSGHGAFIPDDNGDENDKKDETVCLYDGMLRDDSFSKLIDIIPGKVYVISDSCHSATNTKEFFYNIGNKKEKVIKNIDISKIKVKTPGMLGNKNPNILTLSACKDNEVAYDLGKHGAFTDNIIKVIEIKKGKKINYKELNEELTKMLDGMQTPQLMSYRGNDILNDIIFV